MLIESHLILDYLDSLAAADRALFPRSEPDPRSRLQDRGTRDRYGRQAVSLFYEKRLHEEVSDVWVTRCRGQISGVLGVLEADRAARASDYWFGERIGHADIAVAVALRFVSEAHPGLMMLADYPALADHAARLEALPAFREITQPFIPPT